MFPPGNRGYDILRHKKIAPPQVEGRVSPALQLLNPVSISNFLVYQVQGTVHCRVALARSVEGRSFLAGSQ